MYRRRPVLQSLSVGLHYDMGLGGMQLITAVHHQQAATV